MAGNLSQVRDDLIDALINADLWSVQFNQARAAWSDAIQPVFDTMHTLRRAGYAVEQIDGEGQPIGLLLPGHWRVYQSPDSEIWGVERLDGSARKFIEIGSLKWAVRHAISEGWL